jgi:putative transcriptional regulator
MASSLAPAFLLSMPQMLDPNFSRTVVLLCEHSAGGAFGLVVNRPMTMSTRGALVFDLEPPITADHEMQVLVGGPVEPQRSWILVGEQPGEPEELRGVRVTHGLYLSTSPDLLRRLFEPSPPPDARLIVGYSGWGPGQLEAELRASAWLLSDVDPAVIFSTPADRMWEVAIRRLGADPLSLQLSRGIH